MVFSSYEFLAFLAITVLAYSGLERRWRSLALLFLLLASLAFYSWWRIENVPILLATMLFNFYCGRAIATRRTAGLPTGYLLAAGVTANLALLAWFKYAAFAVASLNTATGGELAVPAAGIDKLPLAISFFTFTQIAYLVDASHEDVPRYSMRDYFLFVAFFPHLIAGPIVHHHELMPQFAARLRGWISTGVAVGLTLFIIGLSKKVLLADNLAPIADDLFREAAQSKPGAALCWLGMLAYSLQIYFDFSGYSDMAIGASLMFGIRLPINFFSPYKATSIIEFWRRWHITLSRFLRDYLYIPLGGSRHGNVRRYVNLLLTMLLGGLWHGAGWTFVIWGGLHGLYLIANHAYKAACALIGYRSQSYATLAVYWLLTQLAVVVAWVFFRSPDLPTALKVIDGMSGAHGVGALPASLVLRHDAGAWAGATEAAVVAGAMAIALLCPNSMQMTAGYGAYLDPTGAATRQVGKPCVGRVARALTWQPSTAWSVGMALLFVASLLSLLNVSPFLYFQF